MRVTRQVAYDLSSSQALWKMLERDLYFLDREFMILPAHSEKRRAVARAIDAARELRARGTQGRLDL